MKERLTLKWTRILHKLIVAIWDGEEGAFAKINTTPVLSPTPLNNQRSSSADLPTTNTAVLHKEMD